MKPEQLLGEVQELARTMPPIGELEIKDEPQLAWLGRAAAVFDELGPTYSVPFQSAMTKLHAFRSADAFTAVSQIVILVRRAQYSLQLETGGPLATVVPAGAVFDYFDEIRKIVERATQDILFVDPHLDADFVTSYLSHIKAGVRIRLLTSSKKLTTASSREHVRTATQSDHPCSVYRQHPRPFRLHRSAGVLFLRGVLQRRRKNSSRDDSSDCRRVRGHESGV